jgi:hypothetical protein
MSRLYRGRKLLQRALYDYAVEEGIIDPRRVPRETVLAEAATGTAGPAGPVARAVDLDSYRKKRTAREGGGHDPS